jgi:hypothetical protein
MNQEMKGLYLSFNLSPENKIQEINHSTIGLTTKIFFPK